MLEGTRTVRPEGVIWDVDQDMGVAAAASIAFAVEDLRRDEGG